MHARLFSLLFALGIGLFALPGVCQAAVRVSDRNCTVYADTREVAAAVLQEAAALREHLAERWLGRQLDDGEEKFLIMVHAGQTEYTDHRLRDELRGDRHMIWLRLPDQRQFQAGLSREMQFTMLNLVTDEQLAPWALEGIAAMHDDDAALKTREQMLRWYQRTGNWPDCARLLGRERFFQKDRASHHHAASLTEFLLSRSGRSTLLNFAARGKTIGWDAALEQNYGLRDTQELQQQWQSWVSGRLLVPRDFEGS